MSEQKSFPVRYMALHTWYGWKVIDTSSNKAKVVKRFLGKFRGQAIHNVHTFVKNKNEAEGYVYRP